MRQLVSTILLLVTISTTAQTLAEYEKVHVYQTEDGRLHSKRFADSVQYKANQFARRTKFKETNDSIYYLLKFCSKTELVERYKKEGSFCGNFKRTKLEEIKKQNPFNKIAVIKMVSFKPDTSDERIARAIPKTNGIVDFKKMYEVKVLNKELTEKLLDILVNYHNRDGNMDIAMCYEPRNGIVLMDKLDKVLGYIEICFDCQQFKMEPKTLPVAWFCNEKLDVIQGIFMNAGIAYGMKRDVDW